MGTEFKLSQMPPRSILNRIYGRKYITYMCITFLVSYSDSRLLVPFISELILNRRESDFICELNSTYRNFE